MAKKFRHVAYNKKIFLSPKLPSSRRYTRHLLQEITHAWPGSFLLEAHCSIKGRLPKNKIQQRFAPPLFNFSKVKKQSLNPAELPQNSLKVLCALWEDILGFSYT